MFFVSFVRTYMKSFRKRDVSSNEMLKLEHNRKQTLSDKEQTYLKYKKVRGRLSVLCLHPVFQKCGSEIANGVKV